MDIKDISKAMGTLAASLAEATESDLGMLILNKDRHIGVFVGGQANLDADKMVIRLRKVVAHLSSLADSIASGKTKCDGTAYGMDDDGNVKSLDAPKKKPSTGDADISLLA